jgi:acetoin utilization protein AcuB
MFPLPGRRNRHCSGRADFLSYATGEEFMFVSRSMTRKAITAAPDDRVLDAKAKMAAGEIRHLPVVEADMRLVGILTDRDIRSALPRSFFKNSATPTELKTYAELKVRDIMTTEVITLSPNHTIEDALLLIQKKRVGAFPVVDEQGRLKGIISVRDLLRAFINVLGIGQPGTLLGILVEEKIGQMKKIVDAVTEENISFGSILVARYWDENKRAVFPYLLTQNVSRVKKKLQELGFELLDPMEWYMDQLPQHE